MLVLLITDKLAIYLNDHLAGATAAVELARRAAASNRGSDYDGLAELAREIEEDRRLLIEVMQRFSVGRDRLKLAASWLGEKAGRLKLNGQLVSYSPLSRLEELELLSLGVQGKLALWDALQRAYGADPRLSDIDLGNAIQRGRSQRRRLESLRRRAVAQALGSA